MTSRLFALFLLLAPFGSALGQARRAASSPSPIAQILRDADGDRVPDADGELATIEGTVTTETDAFGEIGPTFYVQDDSGGLAVSLGSPSRPDVQLGDRVRVTGQLYFGPGMSILREARVDTRAPAAAPPSPVPYDADDPERVEGLLVEVEGMLVGTSEGRSWHCPFGHARRPLAPDRVPLRRREGGDRRQLVPTGRPDPHRGAGWPVRPRGPV